MHNLVIHSLGIEADGSMTRLNESVSATILLFATSVLVLCRLSADCFPLIKLASAASECARSNVELLRLESEMMTLRIE